jgi:hypothetical protein
VEVGVWDERMSAREKKNDAPCLWRARGWWVVMWHTVGHGWVQGWALSQGLWPWV